ncbi:hypothetical protein J3A83DRAFT_4371196 [Scleroderma citrinum]
MDSGKLPSYRSSYLLRFHPYPRVKPSARERVMAALAAADEDFITSYNGISMPFSCIANSDFDLANAIAQNLNNVVHTTQSLNTSQRRLSLSSLVVASTVTPRVEPLIHTTFQDLALLARKLP